MMALAAAFSISCPVYGGIPAATAAPSGAARAAAQHRINAAYDNARTTDENQRNWIGSDYLSAKAANSFGVRRTLRIRSRHEVSNNPFLFGIVNSNADDLISTGPTLQVTTPNQTYNRQVEAAWKAWAEEVGLTEKLRTAKVAKEVDGEGFLVFKTVEELESPVKLYPADIEADQVSTPAPANMAEAYVDGLDLHPVTGRPRAYHVLRQHPGDYFFANLNPLQTDKIAASNVIHWFRKTRPGQVRGVPVFTPSLDLFSELRAFRKAVLNHAQIAAAYTGVLESQFAPNGDDPDVEVEAFKRVPIDRGMMATLPAGMKLSAFDAKQPATSYEMFQEKCLGEACRPLNYPLNLALGTSQKFNFSSSKLDHINYRNGLTIERNECNDVALNRLFREWNTEAVLAGAIPAYDGLNPPPHEWHWPGYESIDPAVDSGADQTTLSSGQQTWREFWAKRGKDWRDVMAQQKAEREEMERLGLEFGEPVKRSVTEATDADPDGTGDDEGESAGAGAKPAGKKPGKVGAKARRSGRIAAVKDDNGQEHDENGRFGEGGGGSGTGKGKGKVDPEKAAEHDGPESEREHFHSEDHKREHSEAVAKHAADSKAVADRRAGEDREAKAQRSKEERALEKKHEKENDKVDSARDREEEKYAEKREAKADRADEKRRAKEDAKVEEEREDRDDKREEKWDEEDEKTQARHDEEGEHLTDAEFAEVGKRWHAEYVATKAERDAVIADQQKRDAEEDDARYDAQERRYNEERPELGKQWEKEDAEREKANAERYKVEDDDRYDRQADEESELIEKHDQAAIERADVREAEDDGRDEANERELVALAEKHAPKKKPAPARRRRMGVLARA